jgi:hypothetical protein
VLGVRAAALRTLDAGHAGHAKVVRRSEVPLLVTRTRAGLRARARRATSRALLCAAAGVERKGGRGQEAGAERLAQPQIQGQAEAHATFTRGSRPLYSHPAAIKTESTRRLQIPGADYSCTPRRGAAERRC